MNLPYKIEAKQLAEKAPWFCSEKQFTGSEINIYRKNRLKILSVF